MGGSTAVSGMNPAPAFPDLTHFFAPRSVALIGATEDSSNPLVALEPGHGALVVDALIVKRKP